MRAKRTTLWGVATAAVFAAASAGVAQEPGATGAPGATADFVASETTGAQPVMLAAFGFGGQWPADRWAPITVSVTAGDRPLSGAIIVEYVQDPTQSARITVPFAATPQRTTLVPVIACVPSLCERMTFTMVNERGAPTHRLVYARGGSSTEAQLPAQVDAGHALLVSVGRTTLNESVRDWGVLYSPWMGGVQSTGTPIRRTGLSRSRDEAWTMTAAGRVELDELPLSWVALDGVRVLVVNPQSSGSSGRTADPRAQEAVRTWVRSGGRLVVMADGPGEAWRQWLPEEARGAVEMAPPDEGPLPDDIAALVRKAATDSAARRAQDPENESLRVQVPDPAERTARRVIRLTDAGRGAGWKVRWALEEPADAGLLAEGPAGYGLVTLLGVDPARAPVKLSTRATGQVWRSAMETALSDWLDDAAEMLKARSGGQWAGGTQSGADRSANIAIERVGLVPVTSEWIFWVIGAAMALLAALVGPVDYFVLKRLGAGHRSWMTALAWIGLAAGIAYGAPKFMRTQPTQVNRLTVVDCLVPPLGRGERLAFSTGFTGLYAGQSGVLRLAEPDLSSWWRGTSTAYPWQGRGMRESRGLVPTLQAAAGGEAGSARGNPLTEVPMALWTFRAFRDVSIPGPSRWESRLAARVTDTPAGYSVVVAGLPEGATISSAALRVGDRWYTIEPPAPPPPSSPLPSAGPGARITRGPVQRMGRAPQPAPAAPVNPIGVVNDGSWSAVFPLEHASSAGPGPWTNFAPEPDSAGYYPFADQAAPVNVHPGPLLGVAGPDRRGLAVERRLAGGRFAAVYLELAGLPADVRPSWTSTADHACVLRVLVPLEDGPP